jgi:hypothetical protein
LEALLWFFDGDVFGLGVQGVDRSVGVHHDCPRKGCAVRDFAVLILAPVFT